MSDIIQLLPDHLANQIAAGEVVQRPASIVKELLENSIDAGSQNIRLIIKDAGKTLIQVVDDGIGMSETDARMCFERHATSKIRSTADLFTIRTKGFRGEAMASIAAVAQIEMKTKKHQEELGNLILIEGSKIKTQEPCQAAGGTSISVKNLFFNVPARRNFLKSNPVEMKHIIDEFQHVALAHPDIFFSLYHNNEKLYHLPKGNLRQRIVGVLGNKVNKTLIPIQEDTDIIKIKGYICKPDEAKKTRGEQFFFVNNRFIKSGYLNHAVMNAYEELLPTKKYPLYVIFFEIDPAKIDVNVHPTKQEIKFEDERLVYNYLRVTARHALAQHSVTPTLDFDTETSITSQLHQLDTSNETIDLDNHTTFSSKANNSNYQYTKPEKTTQQQSNIDNWEKLYEQIEKHAQQQGEEQQEEEEENNLFSSAANSTPNLEQTTEEIQNEDQTFSSMASANTEANPQVSKQLYQLHSQYIVSPIKSGFLLIDQNAAHQRILYEHYLTLIENQNATTQKLLFPQTIELATASASILQSMLPQLNNLGLDIKEFGANTFVVHGLPAEFNQVDSNELIQSLLEQFQQNIELKLEIQESIARSLAYQAAIKRGKWLDSTEMQQLVDELFGCSVPFRAPNGKRTFITVELDEITKRFQ